MGLQNFIENEFLGRKTLRIVTHIAVSLMQQGFSVTRKLGL